MIIAQFESIQHERILKPLLPIVLKSVDELYHSNKPRLFFTLYSITFLFLHLISLASADRRRYAIQRNLTASKRSNMLPYFAFALKPR
jgi:hypothetical protein